MNMFCSSSVIHREVKLWKRLLQQCITQHRMKVYKWKNHFSEMKGDVGMSHHEKEGNKKMPIPRQEIIDNPIPTSLFMYYAAVVLCVGTGGAI